MCGLLGQPFWIWMAVSGQQWGVLVLTALYTVTWARGLRMWRPMLLPETLPEARQ